MPSIADSLQRFGYGDPIKKNFEEFFQKQQMEQDQADFNTTLSDAFNHIQNNFKTTPIPGQTQSIPAVGGGSALSALQPQKPAIPADLTNLQPAGMESQTPQAHNIQIPPSTEQTQMSPQEIQTKNKQAIANLLMNSSQFKNLPPEQMQKAQQALQAMAEANQPEIPTSKTGQEDPAKDTYRYDSQGNRTLISKGTPKPKEDKKVVMVDGKGNNNLLNTRTGEITPVTDKEGKNVKHYEKPSKEGMSPSARIALEHFMYTVGRNAQLDKEKAADKSEKKEDKYRENTSISYNDWKTARDEEGKKPSDSKRVNRAWSNVVSDSDKFIEQVGLGNYRDELWKEYNKNPKDFDLDKTIKQKGYDLNSDDVNNLRYYFDHRLF